MGLIISRLYDALLSFSYETPSRILMLGLDAAGKTTILYKVKLNETVQTIPTIGFNVETVTPAPGITFTVWDIGGQDKIRPLYRHYFDKTDGLIFVVDSSDPERFQEAREELFGIITNENMCSVPVVIIANKSDLPTAVKPSELIEQLNLHSISRRKWFIQSACAITGDGIVEAMQQLAQMIKDNRKKITYN
ncbi:unnamed protein product [Rotaria sp. Silwood2]|nr:unnamed protein product [Rotaria sp. Silwood2]CAF2463099.1 unnamed protein product [Rotaria sp. Silwood2]CAF2699196.1 unnamed protein product [Rotaria sp. Silwood2]CAF2853044.1 unnamed protein product [Rotaria sp. Silwood2]CAF3916583.1 unnamed protein product [Rotaria sp. Silwood2]